MDDDRATWLTHDEYLASFTADAGRLAQLLREAPADAPVPTCPGWTAVDLVRHVGDVYSHKVACIRLGRQPEDHEWTSDGMREGDEAVPWFLQRYAYAGSVQFYPDYFYHLFQRRR